MKNGIFTLSVFLLSVFALRAFGADITYPIASVGKIDVDVASSDLEISAANGKDATLEVQKRHWSDDCRVESKLDGETWHVRIEGGRGWNKGCEATLRFSVAPQTSIQVNAASGDMRLEDVSGSIELKTGSGDISLRTLSENVRIRTGSGDIALQLASNVQEAAERKPKVRVDTGSGDIEVKAVKDLKGAELRISTGSGDCAIALPKEAKVSARHMSGSGSVHNAFMASDKATFVVEARSGSGDLVLSAL